MILTEIVKYFDSDMGDISRMSRKPQWSGILPIARLACDVVNIKTVVERCLISEEFGMGIK